MSFNRDEKKVEDNVNPLVSNEVTIEERARIKMKGKSKKATASRNRSPGRLAPAPVSSSNAKGSY